MLRVHWFFEADSFQFVCCNFPLSSRRRHHQIFSDKDKVSFCRKPSAFRELWIWYEQWYEHEIEKSGMRYALSLSSSYPLVWTFFVMNTRRHEYSCLCHLRRLKSTFLVCKINTKTHDHCCGDGGWGESVGKKTCKISNECHDKTTGKSKKKAKLAGTYGSKSSRENVAKYPKILWIAHILCRLPSNCSFKNNFQIHCCVCLLQIDKVL